MRFSAISFAASRQRAEASRPSTSRVTWRSMVAMLSVERLPARESKPVPREMHAPCQSGYARSHGGAAHADGLRAHRAARPLVGLAALDVHGARLVRGLHHLGRA